jgi:hypothetical protein
MSKGFNGVPSMAARGRIGGAAEEPVLSRAGVTSIDSSMPPRAVTIIASSIPGGATMIERSTDEGTGACCNTPGTLCLSMKLLMPGPDGFGRGLSE